ncbi:hypothetical protein BGZ47_002591, partial [Haplosporangium gracile]
NKRKFVKTVEFHDTRTESDKDGKNSRIVEADLEEQGGSSHEHGEIPEVHGTTTEGQTMIIQEEITQEQSITVETAVSYRDNEDVQAYLDKMQAALAR